MTKRAVPIFIALGLGVLAAGCTSVPAAGGFDHVEQNARQALQASERAYVMEVGKITMKGKSKELLENEDIIKAYLGKEKGT